MSQQSSLMQSAHSVRQVLTAYRITSHVLYEAATTETAKATTATTAAPISGHMTVQTVSSAQVPVIPKEH
jgi:hypothetical protein